MIIFQTNNTSKVKTSPYKNIDYVNSNLKKKRSKNLNFKVKKNHGKQYKFRTLKESC